MFSSNFGLLRRSQRGPALKESWTSMTSSAERSMEIGVLDMAFSPPGFKIGEECLPSQQPIVAGLAGGAQTCFGTASGRIGPSTGWDAAFQPCDGIRQACHRTMQACGGRERPCIITYQACAGPWQAWHEPAQARAGRGKLVTRPRKLATGLRKLDRGAASLECLGARLAGQASSLDSEPPSLARPGTS